MGHRVPSQYDKMVTVILISKLSRIEDVSLFTLYFSLTSHKVGMMELADCVGFVPGDAVSEVSIEHWKALLRQNPCVTRKLFPFG